ncbi:hypothetical protein M5689_016101 [Euphorbia peplus]|nr:hypothetical protein M5689_016101 [Euphorbia peplus]
MEMRESCKSNKGIEKARGSSPNQTPLELTLPTTSQTKAERIPAPFEMLNGEDDDEVELDMDEHKLMMMMMMVLGGLMERLKIGEKGKRETENGESKT